MNVGYFHAYRFLWRLIVGCKLQLLCCVWFVSLLSSDCLNLFYFCVFCLSTADFELSQLQDKLRETEMVMENIVSIANHSSDRWVSHWTSLNLSASYTSSPDRKYWFDGAHLFIELNLNVQWYHQQERFRQTWLSCKVRTQRSFPFCYLFSFFYTYRVRGVLKSINSLVKFSEN